MLDTVSVQEYAISKGVSERTVRNWIEKNKIPVIKETLNNREVLRVVINDDKMLSSECSEVLAEVVSEPAEKITKTSGGYSEEMMNKLLENAKLAGQAQLLMDSEARTKEQFFEITQENTQLKIKLAELTHTLQQQEKLTWWQKLLKISN